MMPEEWREVRDWPYEVSNYARVRRSITSGNSHKGRILQGSIDHWGYIRVTLRDNGRCLYAKVHILVCNAFHGMRPTIAHVVAHWDGDKLNNNPANLRWTTAQGNADDAIRLERSRRGRLHHNVRLTEQQVINIRGLVHKNVSKTAIAESYGVSRGCILAIATGDTWAWLK